MKPRFEMGDVMVEAWLPYDRATGALSDSNVLVGSSRMDIPCPSADVLHC